MCILYTKPTVCAKSIGPTGNWRVKGKPAFAKIIRQAYGRWRCYQLIAVCT